VATASATSATITWTTDENSSSSVSYGTTISYGTDTAESDTSPRVTSHSVLISGLNSCTTYHYTVNSTDTATNVGVFISASNNNLAENNLISTSGSATDYGVYVYSSALWNTINNNTIRTYGSTNSHGIHMAATGSNYPFYTNISNIYVEILTLHVKKRCA
jgi:hypothetical protein